MKYELDEELSALVKRIDKLFEGYTPGDFRRAIRSGARFDRVNEGWVAPATVAGAMALGGASATSGEPSQPLSGANTDSVQTDTDSTYRPPRKTTSWKPIDDLQGWFQGIKSNNSQNNGNYGGGALGRRPNTAKNIQDAAKERNRQRKGK